MKRKAVRLLKGMLLFSAFLMILGLAPYGVSAQNGTIQGIVTDSATGLPLGGVMLMAHPAFDGPPAPGQGGGHGGGHHGYRAVTGEDGTYAMEVPAGNYHVGAFTFGYFPAHAEAAVVEGEATTVNFALDPLTFGTVAGTVTDAGTGQPIAGAMICARPSFGEPPLSGLGNCPFGGHQGMHDGAGRKFEPKGEGHEGGMHGFSAVTGEDGTYSLELPTGDYVIMAHMQGYSPADVEATVNDGETTTVNFALAPLAFGSIAGTVTDGDTGLAIMGAHVGLRPSPGQMLGEGPHGGGHHGGGHHGFHAVTGEDGTYRIENVPVGDYMAMAWAVGYMPSDPAEVTIAENQTTVQDFALDPREFGNLYGHLMKGAHGKALRNKIREMWLQGAGFEEIRAALKDMLKDTEK